MYAGCARVAAGLANGAKCLSGKILNPLNQLWFKSCVLIRGHDLDATEP